MTTEIPLKGYTAVPSDYNAPDGDLAHSLNLINEDGALRPIFPPSVLFSLSENAFPLYIHKTATFLHYIIVDIEQSKYYWIDSTEITPGTTVNPEALHLLANFHDYDYGLGDFSSLGNVLIATSPTGLFHFLWDVETESYTYLGNHLPEVDIDFALMLDSFDTMDGTVFSFSMADSENKYSNAIVKYFGLDNDRRGSYRPQQQEEREVMKYCSDAVIGAINKYIAESTADNKFTMPFFVRYAFRLFDGSHVMLSAPILMIPNSGKPKIKITGMTITEGELKISNQLFFPRALLMFRFLSGISALKRWEKLITHIDFFVSQPIFTFDQNSDLTLAHRVSDTTSVSDFSHVGSFTSQSGTRTETNHHRPSAGALGSDTLYTLGENKEKTINVSGRCWQCKAKTRKEIESGIKDTSIFYKIAELNIADIIETDKFMKVDTIGSSLTTLATRQTLDDEIYTHHAVIPRFVHAYNARLNIANISMLPFNGFPIRSMTQYTYSGKENSSVTPITIYVRVRSNDNIQWVCCNPDRNTGELSRFCYDSIKANFPRWLFYPDSSATEMIISLDDGYYRLNLTTHDFLNGAYWFRGMGDDLPEFIEGEIPDEIRLSAENPREIKLINRLFTSNVNNPFSFPVTAMTSVGTGEILGISSAARALSQGQFGQFPLYAFSTDGIWALTVSSSGSYSAVQPIARDVAVNPDSITQIDTAVLFASDRGIMLISGSQISCISEIIDTDFPFKALQSLPKLTNASSLIKDMPEIISFKDFLSSCKMAYDYINQRIYIYNPNPIERSGATSVSHPHFKTNWNKHLNLKQRSLILPPYSFVYSMKSKLWGIASFEIIDTLNSYPDALAIDFNNRVIDLAVPDTEQPHQGVYITRPITLDSPDILKTIRTVIQRGQFRRGNVQTILYASRDLINWFPVKSSVDHFLRGFSGSPWKYFRVVGLASLAPGESISSLSIEYQPKFTNRLR